MARLTKTDAAHQRGIARATLSTLIAQGTVGSTPDGLIAQAELVRVAPSISPLHERRTVKIFKLAFLREVTRSTIVRTSACLPPHYHGYSLAI